MKRIALGVLLAVMMAVSAAAFSADQDFALVNKTGLTIDELYISPVNENEWGEDVLGVDLRPRGDGVQVGHEDRRRRR